MRYYAGIGSRKTPASVLVKMEKLATQLAVANFCLRSGAADGADAAFERGCDAVGGYKQIFLPWKNFNGSDSPLYHVSEKALTMAQTLHPAWGSLSRAAKLLHARNCFQVLGSNLDTPVEFVLCWTPDGAETEQECGKETGGTGTAIKLAHRLGIRVVNLQCIAWRDILVDELME